VKQEVDENQLNIHNRPNRPQAHSTKTKIARHANSNSRFLAFKTRKMFKRGHILAFEKSPGSKGLIASYMPPPKRGKLCEARATQRQLSAMALVMFLSAVLV
jgi:hypothetical protein